MTKEFKYKEIIQVNMFHSDEPAAQNFNQAQKQSTPTEHLDNYYNWMCLMVGTYNKDNSRLADEHVTIADLSDPYEHKSSAETINFRASFILTFHFEELVYEHPKWYRNWFHEELNQIYKEYLKDECIYTEPPGAILNLSRGFNVSEPFVKHVNHQPI
jgi:hypothetical protein